MKKFIIPIIFILILVIFAVFGIFWWRENTKPVSDDQFTKDFLIVRGRSASQIGEYLYDEGLIRNPLAFKIYVQVSGRAGQIQAGEFKLSPSFSLQEIINALTSGPTELWVTVPEGLRREEAAERFIESLEMSTADAIIFRQGFLTESAGMEGFLFPDTYLFPRDVDAQTVISTMRNTFDRRTSDFQGDIEGSELTLEEIVTLASIIERETKTDAERPLVSGILLNRLNIGMALQVDASVQYAVASENCELNENCQWWPVLTREDLQINSSYNTYRFTGFPPAPIASPGLSSLRAAVNPANTEYFYYIHDPSGQIHYAETLEEHNRNVQVYLN